MDESNERKAIFEDFYFEAYNYVSRNHDIIFFKTPEDCLNHSENSTKALELMNIDVSSLRESLTEKLRKKGLTDIKCFLKKYKKIENFFEKNKVSKNANLVKLKRKEIIFEKFDSLKEILRLIALHDLCNLVSGVASLGSEKWLEKNDIFSWDEFYNFHVSIKERIDKNTINYMAKLDQEHVHLIFHEIENVYFQSTAGVARKSEDPLCKIFHKQVSYLLPFFFLQFI